MRRSPRPPRRRFSNGTSIARRPSATDWVQWLDTMTYEQFMRDEMGLSGEPLEEIKRYIDPVAAAQGCGLGSDVISAYSAYTFVLPGVVPFYRWSNHGADPTDQLYLASFPGGTRVRHAAFSRNPSGRVQGRVQPRRHPQQSRAVGPARQSQSPGAHALVGHGDRDRERGALVPRRATVTYSKGRQAVPRHGEVGGLRGAAARQPAHLPRHTGRVSRGDGHASTTRR